MSRIGKLPIAIPEKVKVNISGSNVTVTGPKGELKRTLHPDMAIHLQENTITVARPTDSKDHRSLHGLTRTLLSNMVEGVSKGFEKGLEIVGVGYRAEKAGDKLVLRVGLSHMLEVTPPPGLSFVLDGTNRVKVVGANKEMVGEMAAKIRKMRPPDSYKGKGIRYIGEYVRLKPGKAGKVVGKK
jgi:large subunit ribosomal protein L6